MYMCALKKPSEARVGLGCIDFEGLSQFVGINLPSFECRTFDVKLYY
jgi:hypothetical protein